MSNNDDRTLHVGYLYKSYQKMDLTTILFQTTAKFAEKFKQIAKGETSKGKKIIGGGSQSEAAKLQAFFQAIKTIDANHEAAGSQYNSAYLTIIQAALSDLGPRKQKIFTSKMTGQEFETALQAIINETINQSQLNPSNSRTMAKTLQDTSYGTMSFTTTKKGAADLMQIPQAIARDLVWKSGESIGKKLKDELQVHNPAARYVNVNIKKGTATSNAKIDGSGAAYADMSIEFGANAELNEIANLLRYASFSEKNYSLEGLKARMRGRAYSLFKKGHQASGSERDKLFALGSQLKDESNRDDLSLEDIDLKLGNTKLNTLFFALFGDTYPAPVVLSLLFYVINTAGNNSDIGAEVTMKLNQLRFIYELTGYGQHYFGDNQQIEKQFQTVAREVFKDTGFEDDPFRVNYFIWNDPGAGGSIYVQSAAQLITEMFESYSETALDARKQQILEAMGQQGSIMLSASSMLH